ncbi:MAG: hypothetical protein IKU53_02950 [Firmicutes bacterium]|nr:hypothetical protein [Bacillota bacterium]
MSYMTGEPFGSPFLCGWCFWERVCFLGFALSFGGSMAKCVGSQGVLALSFGVLRAKSVGATLSFYDFRAFVWAFLSNLGCFSMFFQKNARTN